jgi:hypothetical protein
MMRSIHSGMAAPSPSACFDLFVIVLPLARIVGVVLNWGQIERGVK